MIKKYNFKIQFKTRFDYSFYNHNFYLKIILIIFFLKINIIFIGFCSGQSNYKSTQVIIQVNFFGCPHIYFGIEICSQLNYKLVSLVLTT